MSTNRVYGETYGPSPLYTPTGYLTLELAADPLSLLTPDQAAGVAGWWLINRVSFNELFVSADGELKQGLANAELVAWRAENGDHPLYDPDYIALSVRPPGYGDPTRRE